MTKTKYILSISLVVMVLFSYAQKVDTTLNISGVEVVGEQSISADRIIINDNNRSKEDVGKILKESPNINIIKRGNYATDPVIRVVQSRSITTPPVMVLCN